ncbi:hypothetical protein DAPPUDRAFT_264075 [Daphnia pulex]|uniref:Reverse transcriptase domain-containing protein n=1 Tax=Daphnia pulex TaxID=6669 RepID=E9HQU6_DAPPU|nr:hypothetical protein DAPPUDRAFT_264075 [Daphnia pulex]|eukprot:EFX65887.1 hypothetical protein DAPPUDRAFT_264075 [Daphnia pulex]
MSSVFSSDSHKRQRALASRGFLEGSASGNTLSIDDLNLASPMADGDSRPNRGDRDFLPNEDDQDSRSRASRRPSPSTSSSRKRSRSKSGSPSFRSASSSKCVRQENTPDAANVCMVKRSTVRELRGCMKNGIDSKSENLTLRSSYKPSFEANFELMAPELDPSMVRKWLCNIGDTSAKPKIKDFWENNFLSIQRELKDVFEPFIHLLCSVPEGHDAELPIKTATLLYPRPSLSLCEKFISAMDKEADIDSKLDKIGRLGGHHSSRRGNNFSHKGDYRPSGGASNYPKPNWNWGKPQQQKQRGKQQNNSFSNANSNKYLNFFVSYEHFKMEGIDHLKHLIRENDWLVKLDLQDAYFVVSVAPEHQKFLHDILVMGASPEEAIRHLHLIIELLTSVGFLVPTLCGGLEPPIDTICQLDPSAECVGCKDILPEVNRSTCVRVSPLHIDPAVSVENQERTSNPSPHLSVMAGPDLVSVALGNVGGSPSHISITPSSYSFQQVCTASASEMRQISAWILSGIATKSEAFRLKLSSCYWPAPVPLQQLPISPPGTIGYYLNDQFWSGFASQTIKSLRSMLSMTLDPIDCHRIGEHPLNSCEKQQKRDLERENS